jgi:hypothetical protein
MAVTERHGVQTSAPSWKVLVMTAVTVLTPLACRLFNRYMGEELLTDGDITALTGFLTFAGGYLAPPQGVA